MDDYEAWKIYPKHRNWFNKLWLSDKLGYDCGPSGVAPTVSREYIIRPIYNLAGMGVGARIEYIEADDYTKVEPGYFWCELFTGEQLSVSYEFEHGVMGVWKPIHGYKSIRTTDQMWKFSAWKKISNYPPLSRLFNELSDVGIINVEFVGLHPIEVHLRDTPDPAYDSFIPVWKGEEDTIDIFSKIGYTYIQSYEDADGFLHTPRLGFMVKNRSD